MCGANFQGHNVKDEGRKVTYLTKYCQSVVGQKSVGFVHKKVSAYELLKAPVLALYKPVRALALCTLYGIVWVSDTCMAPSAAETFLKVFQNYFGDIEHVGKYS